MTSAISGLSAALYRDDPDAASVAFTEMSLVDSGDHIIWQAPYGYRFWDEDETLIIEKQVHSTGDWVDITSSCTVNWLQGKIAVSAALNADDLVRATGDRRDEADFIKIANLYDGKLKIDGKEIDITSCEDDGWGSTMASSKSWEFTASAFFYAILDHVDLLSSELIAKFYSFNRQGKHTGAVSPSIDISGGSDTKFKIQADEEATATEITLTVAGKNTGALIAAEMQSKIQAEGGAYAAVTVAYTGVDIPGWHESGATPSTDISGGTDTKFKIQADSEGSATTVTLSVTGKNTGPLIATEMQTKIRALGGAYANVAVHYRDGIYLIVSGTAGPLSKIRITDGDTNNVADDLKIGTLGTNYDGSGGQYVITSGTRGPNSKIRITDGASLNIADDLNIGTEGTDSDGSAYAFVGRGTLNNIENMVANPNDAQKETLTFKGKGEVYAES